MRTAFATKALLAMACIHPAWVLAATPSEQQIVGWINNLDQSSASPAKAIHVVASKEVKLLSGEQAFISSVTFENAGRNFWAGYVLSRPKIRQSKILPYGGQSNTFIIHPYSHKGKLVHIVEFNSAGSGQGSVEGSKTLTVLDGWNIKTLREAEEGSYEGSYNDKLGDSDCKTGYNNQVFFNVMEYDSFIVETSIKANACSNLTAKDYKVQTQLIPIRF